jgi:predicted ABC-class ATPase
MQALVAADKEPITPFIAKVRALYEELGVSSVLVIGGSGDYFDVADSVVMMDAYVPQDVTLRAKAIAAEHAGQLPSEERERLVRQRQVPFGPRTARVPFGASFRVEGKCVARGKDKIQYGSEVDLELSAVEQLVEVSQTRAISDAMRHLCATAAMANGATLRQVLAACELALDEQGLDAIAPFAHVGNYARPRRFELAAAINRFRGAQFTSHLMWRK